ncbi:hypothetical protein EHI8A_165750 [Entamoeba histolytica HM-1:IMSS-B]|uniref:Uncharacterized protein n=6 Tax=Entamoeba histolytica TaxID=5759 RepID=C4LZG1_ENTH1|nr:hypothetical protein EHI_138010 [Entamoeba histolytica HM-1:IMSS]EMD45830.1 Hypothetical protein EHI5A_121690 [Entamoeba histolytica KU27]EMH77566.1 hypothetical protein EHI8A_165750 [Entamoeba histolytica HM-1:IMSS-B]EMS15703.1 hypothetical protein KM1_237380 [Entamoeba histolytica HM-3:IMSS]ENY66023.1 hypothetical protein EHI7A_147440 [Entamoeba histolytica HM-1:IMSS-A]GAT94251.1 hypothetical protein CL6EHI_138010 [Entamoeba histolytica]|eukprot:XP_655902.1 hypothetical protein EHI_138010 [Entamoeba histolytica HM-1:IMSS]
MFKRNIIEAEAKDLDTNFISQNNVHIKTKAKSVKLPGESQKSGIIIWMTEGETTFLHVLKYENEKLTECLRAWNYKGNVIDAYLSERLPFTITVLTANNIAYRITASSQDPTTPLVEKIDVGTVKPSQIRCFDTDKTRELVLILDKQIRKYFQTWDSINEKTRLKEEEERYEISGEFQIADPSLFECNCKYFITRINDSSLPRPSLGMLTAKYFLMSNSFAGVEIKSWDDNKFIIRQNVTPKQLSKVSIDNSAKYLAAVDITGTYCFIYQIEKSELIPFGTYYRGQSQSQVQQLSFSHDAKIVIFVSSKSIRFIPLPGSALTLGTYIDEQSICCFSSPTSQTISVCEVNNENDPNYIFIVVTENSIVQITFELKTGRIENYHIKEFEGLVQMIKSLSQIDIRSEKTTKHERFYFNYN